MNSPMQPAAESLGSDAPLNHVVAFFHSQDEEYDTLLPFIRDGFARGDKAFHIVDSKLKEAHLERLRGAAIDTAAAEARRQLEVKVWEETYLRTGRFDPADMMRVIEDILKKGRSEEFSATRLIGHMDWILGRWPGTPGFLEYEAGLNRVLPSYRDPVVCVYNSARIDAKITMEILRSHPAVMISGVMHRNPFFIGADEQLRELRTERGEDAESQSSGFSRARRMRHSINELVALSILPAEWVGRDPGQIAEEIVSILMSCARIRTAHLRLRHEGVNVARTQSGGFPQFEAWVKTIDNSPPGSAPISEEHRIELPGPVKTLHVLQIPIGIDAQAGWIAVGSTDPEFPDELERLLLTVAANVGLTSFQNARLLQERERTSTMIEVLGMEVDRTGMFDDLVGTSPAMQKVILSVSKVAPTDSTVLITGETGTGKELVARSIHKRSRRPDGPFVSVNGAALPPSLISSELFGYEKGAFTGADQRRLGRFELANHGTLFLDEVGELSMEMQAALLRVLQERVIDRVGGSQPIAIDVRLIAATNRDLRQAVANGTFRSDLFYRLNVFPIEMPPLRERKEDIPLLTRHFIEVFSRKLGKKITRIDPATLESFKAYTWPGNIRELQNVIERALILSDGETFSTELGLPPEPLPGEIGTFSDSIARHERTLIETALQRSGGKVSGAHGAARQLGLPATTLESRIKALGIKKQKFRS